jgi:hypothetical protein
VLGVSRWTDLGAPALQRSPLAAPTQQRKIAVVSSFYALAERHELIVRTPLIGVSRP